MSSLTIDKIKNICTKFINDPDTTIGIENQWFEYLVKEHVLNYKKEEIMRILNIDRNDIPTQITVNHSQYGNTNIYITVCENGIIISTKKWLIDKYAHKKVLI
jgi:hypothetical protein